MKKEIWKKFSFNILKKQNKQTKIYEPKQRGETCHENVATEQRGWRQKYFSCLYIVRINIVKMAVSLKVVLRIQQNPYQSFYDIPHRNKGKEGRRKKTKVIL